MLPQVTGGKADSVEMFRRFAAKMGIAVWQYMSAMMQNHRTGFAGSIGWQPCMTARNCLIAGDRVRCHPGTNRKTGGGINGP